MSCGKQGQAGRMVALLINHEATIAELAELLKDTYALWHIPWVGFNWHSYTPEHVQRVRTLSQQLGTAVGADTQVLAYAALLHDVTKMYDGEIVMHDGQRVLDDKGRWRNEVVLPRGSSEITEIYDELGLTGTLHNESGAAVAEELLRRRGMSSRFREQVGDVIRAHLQADSSSPREDKVLYDADTIDANIGLPAFHRNLYINLHREEQARADFSAWVDQSRHEFLRYYLGERVPNWIRERRPMFLERLTTEQGRDLGTKRYDRLQERVSRLLAELENGGDRDGLRVMDYLIEQREDPKLSQQIEALRGLCGPEHAFACELYKGMTREMLAYE